MKRNGVPWLNTGAGARFIGELKMGYTLPNKEVVEMGYTLPNKEVVGKITQIATECFKSFGGGQENKDSILEALTKDDPAIFALGVGIKDVVTMVLTMAGYQGLLDACEASENARHLSPSTCADEIHRVHVMVENAITKAIK